MTRADGRLLPLDGIVTVAGKQARIERRAGTEERPILRLEGHSGREAAEALRGEPLLVARTDLPELEPGEYWAHELEGCTVVDGKTPVGVVKRLVPLPSCEAIEVQRDGAPDLLVPLVRDAIRKVDVKRRRIDVDLEFLGDSG